MHGATHRLTVTTVHGETDTYDLEFDHSSRPMPFYNDTSISWQAKHFVTVGYNKLHVVRWTLELIQEDDK